MGWRRHQSEADRGSRHPRSNRALRGQRQAEALLDAEQAQVHRDGSGLPAEGWRKVGADEY